MIEFLFICVLVGQTGYILHIRDEYSVEIKRLTDALEKAQDQVRLNGIDLLAALDQREVLHKETLRLTGQLRALMTLTPVPEVQTHRQVPRTTDGRKLWPSPTPSAVPAPTIVHDTTPDNTSSLVLGVALGMALNHDTTPAKADTTPAPAPEPDRSSSYDSGSSSSSYDSGSSGSSDGGGSGD